VLNERVSGYFEHQHRKDSDPLVKSGKRISMNPCWRISMQPIQATKVNTADQESGKNCLQMAYVSDRRSQYCSNVLQQTLNEYGLESSVSRKGNCWDNVPTEILWGSLKVGRLYGMKFETRRRAMDEMIDCMTFYNHRGLHSTLGFISPMQVEKNWLSAQLKDAA
jgi:transposase InsO family protein